ncbi:MAG: hypothetical protein QOJ39_3110 [Candidatus Eremiobacteraeota bacterium]|nr:hypothetical protein [Candidatus Eremiobacteraeota bacterium]
MNSEFYERLDSRVRELENVVHGLRADLEAGRVSPNLPAAHAQPPPAGAEAVAAAASAPPQQSTYEQMFGSQMPREMHEIFERPPVVPAARSKPAVSLETLLAGRGLLLVGMLLVLLAAAFFLNVAIARGWLGPAEQVLLALGVGSGLIVYAARRIGRDLTFLSEGLIGLGAGIDYLALWASVSVFPELHVPRPLAFAGMVVVTAVLALLATSRRSERLALLGLLGGYMTPALLANGSPDRAFLAAYLLVLTVTMLGVGVRSSFRSVEVLTFVAVACYSPAFIVDSAHHWTDVMCAVVATIFFATFAVAFTLAAMYDRKITRTRLTLLVLDTLGYMLVLDAVFSARHNVLGWVLLLLAAVLLVTARTAALPRRLSSAYLYLGLSAATLAFPALFQSMSLTDVFTVEAGLLVLLGTRAADRWLLLTGAALFIIVGFVLLGDAALDPPRHEVLSSLVLAFAIYVASLGFALSQLQTAAISERAKRGWWTAGTVVLHVVALAGLSRECVDVLGGPKGFDGLSNEAQLGLSAIWTLYATGLFGAGMARHQALWRWLGLGLFGWTVFKVFVVDLAALDVVYRILSFLGLGIVLVGVSAWYQRTMARQAADGET